MSKEKQMELKYPSDLHSERLRIAPFRRSDFNMWFQAVTTQKKPRSKFDQKPLNPDKINREHFLKLISFEEKWWNEERHYQFHVFLKDIFIGDIALMFICREGRQWAEMSCYLDNRYWGKGYGYEACEAVIDCAFEKMQLHQLFVLIEKENRRSIKLFKKLGFYKVGLMKRSIFTGTKDRDDGILFHKTR